MIKNLPLQKRSNGFSLIELTMVLMIVALLSTGLLFGMSAQRNAVEHVDTERQLENIREVLFGFAISNGRLPCPAEAQLASIQGGEEAKVCIVNSCPEPTGAISGTEADKLCTFEHGVLPWKTLGISETDTWGNRYTYFVGREFSNPITWKEKNEGKRARFNLETLGRSKIEDGLHNVIASYIPAVVVSHGKRAAGAFQTNGSQLPNAARDELENAKATLTFISYPPNDNFDDQVIWIVPAILKSRMVAAGRLP